MFAHNYIHGSPKTYPVTDRIKLDVNSVPAVIDFCKHVHVQSSTKAGRSLAVFNSAFSRDVWKIHLSFELS
jgi:hypothetical protein